MGGLEPKNVSFSDQQQGNQILKSAAIDRQRGSDLFIADRLVYFFSGRSRIPPFRSAACARGRGGHEPLASLHR
jgi:hypothetical protein